MPRRLLLLLLPLLLPLTGCFDETLELTLQPDGSGRLHLEIKLGKSLASMHKLTADMHAMQLKYLDPGEEAPLSPDDTMLGERLLDFSGIDAWSNTSVTTNEKGELVLSADGWFGDVNQVRRDVEGSGTGFVLTSSEAGTRTLEFRQLPAPEDLENVDAAIDALRMLRRMGRGMKQTVALRLPAAPGEVSGLAADPADPRRVTASYGVSDMDGYMERYVAAARKLWPQVQEGTLSREDALEALTVAINQPRTCARFPAEAAVDEALQVERAEAIKAWASSPWPQTLERVREKLALEAVGIDPDQRRGPFPKGLVDEESFTLELQPNGGAKVAFRAAFAAGALPEPLQSVGAESQQAELQRAALSWLGSTIQGVGFERWSLVFDEQGGAVIEGTGYSGPNQAIVHAFENQEDFEEYRVLTLVRRWDPRRRTTELWIEAEAGEGAPLVKVAFAPPQPAAGTVGFEASEDGVLSWTLRPDAGEKATTGWSVPAGIKGMSSEFQQAHTEVSLKFAKQQLDASLEELKQLTGDDEDE